MLDDGRDIILIGPRGAGKTSVGSRLALELDRPFVDTDEIFVSREKCTIHDYFVRNGEAAFRIREAQIIAELGNPAGRVIATGGGAVLRASNRRRLEGLGVIIFLDVDAQTAIDRLSHDSERPALTELDPLREIESLIDQRRPVYASLCDLHVDARGPVGDVAARCMQALRSRPN